MPPRSTSSSSPLSRYHRQSRDLLNSLVMVIPLFVIYQIGVLYTGGIRNGVDFLTDLLWWSLDANLNSYLLVQLGVLLFMVLAIFLLRRKRSFSLRVWPWVILESTLYAFFFGGIVLSMMSLFHPGLVLSTAISDQSLLSILTLSIGAGLYEELVFRLLMMGGLLAIAHRLLHWPRWIAALTALILSSLAFSAVHHIGPFADPFTPEIFAFRFFAGCLLALIFWLRGFAVAVYTHGIYDILVLI